MSKKKVVYGWHLMPSDRKLRYGDGRRVFTGRRLSIPKGAAVVLCVRGMHAAVTLNSVMWSAVSCTPGVLSYVKVEGDIMAGPTKFAGRHRTVVWSRALPKDRSMFGASGQMLRAWVAKKGWLP